MSRFRYGRWKQRAERREAREEESQKELNALENLEEALKAKEETKPYRLYRLLEVIGKEGQPYSVLPFTRFDQIEQMRLGVREAMVEMKDELPEVYEHSAPFKLIIDALGDYCEVLLPILDGIESATTPGGTHIARLKLGAYVAKRHNCYLSHDGLLIDSDNQFSLIRNASAILYVDFFDAWRNALKHEVRLAEAEGTPNNG